MEPDHVSVYNLTIEDRTAFGGLQRAGLLSVPDSGVVRRDVRAHRRAPRPAPASATTKSRSWARPGRRAVHNTLYWTGGEYLGLGCSAHSFRRLPDGGGRALQRRPLASTSGCARPPSATRETLDAAALEREAVWLGLRFLDGIDRAAHARLYGVDPVAAHADEVARLVAEGLVTVTPSASASPRAGSSSPTRSAPASSDAVAKLSG